MQEQRVQIEPQPRQAAIKRAIALQWFTVFWNIAEGCVALVAAIPSHSIALTGFGIDSLIETASAAVVLWRLMHEISGASAERIASVEKATRKIAGALLLLLALYVGVDSIRHLFGFGERTHESLLGVTLTVVALIVMTVLSKAKLKAANAIESAAMKADAMQATCCAWLALTTLLGLGLNAMFHWWWADAVAGCAIVPLLLREGVEAINGGNCGCHDACKSGDANSSSR